MIVEIFALNSVNVNCQSKFKITFRICNLFLKVRNFMTNIVIKVKIIFLVIKIS